MTQVSFPLRLLRALALIGALFGVSFAAQARADVAIFAGGCFWSMQHDMEHIPGVVDTVVGYTGGHVARPSYEQVSSETTGHLEAIKVTFDPKRISYASLVERYWRLIDPTDAGGAFCDRGASYHSAIFTLTPEQKQVAEASREALNGSGPLKGRIVTAVRDAGPFWVAEDYHQHYADKNPFEYGVYRAGCGKDAMVRRIWGAQAFH